MRLYGGLNEGATSADGNTLNTAAFVGYKADAFNVGAEYNYMDKAGSKQSGYSVFTSVKLTDETNLYARWDELFAGNAVSKDAAILGAQFKVGKYIKVAPNVRMQMDRKAGNNTYEGYVSCHFGL